MKKTIAAFVAVFTLLAEPASAQVPSLPIGSTNAVLQDALRHLTGVSWGVELISTDGLYIEQFLAKQALWTAEVVAHLPRFPKEAIWDWNYERDGEPTAFLKRKLADDINGINWNKPEYAGRQFQTTYTGIKDLIPQDTWYLVFGDINEFVLTKNEKGELVTPPSAYTIDLVAAVMRGSGHAFFVENIERAILEVEDEAGKIVDRLDSREYVPYVYPTVKVVARDGVLFLPIKYATSGQPGRVFVWYKSGAQQVFSLADGHLLPSLTIRRAANGVELLVSSAETFTIEVSENLLEWSALYLPLIEPAAPTLVHRFIDPRDAGTRFYRLRMSAGLQNRR